MLYEKFTTLSIFFSFLNRLLNMLSQMGLWDLTDDNFLPLILVSYLSTILAHTSSMNICWVNKGPHLQTSAEKGIHVGREAGVWGQYGGPWMLWCGGENKEGHLQELEPQEHRGRKYLGPTQMQEHLNADWPFPNAGSNIWGCPLRCSWWSLHSNPTGSNQLSNKVVFKIKKKIILVRDTC